MVFLAAAIAVFVLWIWYFGELVRPTDIWDVCPLGLVLVFILLGVRFGGLGHVGLALIGASYKRDLVLALAFGTLAELSIWALMYLTLGDSFSRSDILLDRLQEPGIRIGEVAYRHSYAHLGRTGSLWVADGSVFAVLIAMWSLTAFTVLSIVKLLRYLFGGQLQKTQK